MNLFANHEVKYILQSKKEKSKVGSAKINAERGPLIITCDYIENPLVPSNFEAKNVAISYKI